MESELNFEASSGAKDWTEEGDQTEEQYSRIGQTNEKYKRIIEEVEEKLLKCLKIKPSAYGTCYKIM